MRKMAYVFLGITVGFIIISAIVAYFGLAPSNLNYSFVWVIYFGMLLLAASLGFSQLVLFKRSSSTKVSAAGRYSLLALGGILILAAVPAGMMFELSANGCCGAPSGPPYGIALSATMIIAGLLLIVKNSKKN